MKSGKILLATVRSTIKRIFVYEQIGYKTHSKVITIILYCETDGG